MKRYGYLYHKVYDFDNIEEAHKNSRKGKSYYHEVQKVDENPQYYYLKIHKMLKNKTFSNSDYKVIKKRTLSGKVRTIHKLPYFPDRIIHHCIVQILEPIWIKSFIIDTYSCIPNRGIHKCVRKLKRVLKNKEDTKYCLKLDVKKYYPSINHSILKQIIRKKIKDYNLLCLLDEIIDSASGVPIGNYLSQYFGNLYLNYFDHWIKEDLKYKYYFRYCDDMIILHNNKKNLHKLKDKIEYYLNNKLKLKLKNNWQIFPVNKRGIDFLGYKFFHRFTLIRKSLKERFKKRVNYIKNNWRKINPISIISSIMSYLGWFKFANCYNLIKKYMDKKLKNIIIFSKLEIYKEISYEI